MVLVELTVVLALVSFITCLFVLGLVGRHIVSPQQDWIATRSDDAILISGCDSGIGLELAKYFYTTCSFKIICGFLKPEQSVGYKELEGIASASDDGERLILKKLDLTSSDEIEELVRSIERLKEEGTLARLVGLINNAGTMIYGEFDWLTWSQVKSQIDVNFIGTIRLTYAMKDLIRESKGRIINVSSVNDTTVFPGLSIYSATKSGLSAFSRGLGYELRKFDAHVITVRLGDFARLTNIMASHSSNQEEMWISMNEKKKTIYKEFFEQFNSHLLKNYGMTSPRNFQDSSLFQDFKYALLSKHPPTTITCAPLHFKIFYFLTEMVPVWFQYHLLDFLIRVGFNWEPPLIVT